MPRVPRKWTLAEDQVLRREVSKQGAFLTIMRLILDLLLKANPFHHRRTALKLEHYFAGFYKQKQ